MDPWGREITRLALEHTSGLSCHAARQDFGAKAICDNLNALAAYVATKACLDVDSPYKINRTVAIDKIKCQLGRWLLLGKSTVRSVCVILSDLALNRQKFVPGRSKPRHHRSKPHGFCVQKCMTMCQAERIRLGREFFMHFKSP